MKPERKYYEQEIPLDKTGKNNLYIRIRILQNIVESFSITYVNVKNGHAHPIVRVDSSLHERVHFHHLYNNPPTKEYRNQSLDSDTVAYYRKHLETHWRLYLAKYEENYI